jgi:hypothetical protein
VSVKCDEMLADRCAHWCAQKITEELVDCENEELVESVYDDVYNDVMGVLDRRSFGS